MTLQNTPERAEKFPENQEEEISMNNGDLQSANESVTNRNTESHQSELSDDDIQALNEKYHDLTVDERVAELYRDFDINNVMLTSSFAATSAFFLHVFSRVAPQQKVFFIDTGFHFPETLEYRKKLIDLYQLNVVDIRPEDWKHEFTEIGRAHV